MLVILLAALFLTATVAVSWGLAARQRHFEQRVQLHLFSGEEL